MTFGSLIAVADQASAQTAVIHTVVDVNMRSQPNSSSTRVGGIAAGTGLTTIDCAAPGQSVNGVNVWMHLTANGATGYYASAWDGYCLAFVYQAYLYGAGTDVTSGLPYASSHNSAYTYWTVAANRHAADRNPPAGALVFWRSASSPTGPGHVGLSEGGGTIISSYDGRTRGVHTFNINSYQQNLYLGWVKNW